VKPFIENGKAIVELKCPIHGPFNVAEDSLDNLHGAEPKKKEE